MGNRWQLLLPAKGVTRHPDDICMQMCTAAPHPPAHRLRVCMHLRIHRDLALQPDMRLHACLLVGLALQQPQLRPCLTSICTSVSIAYRIRTGVFLRACTRTHRHITYTLTPRALTCSPRLARSLYATAHAACPEPASSIASIPTSKQNWYWMDDGSDGLRHNCMPPGARSSLEGVPEGLAAGAYIHICCDAGWS